MMILRDYQLEAVSACAHALKSEKKALIVAATGSGKSAIAAGICQRVLERNPSWRVLVLCYVQEILMSNHEACVSLGVTNSGVYCAGAGRRDKTQSVIHASRDSLGNNPTMCGKFDVIIVDEGHLLSADDESRYQKIITALAPRFLIALTATPFRLDGGYIYGKRKMFPRICFEIGMDELVKRGALVPFVFPKAQKLVDTAGTAIKRGEFDSAAIENLVNDDAIIDASLAQWALHAGNRHCSLFFCHSIEHGIRTFEAFKSMFPGLPCAFLDGTTKKVERAAIIDGAREGHFKAVFNVSVLCLDDQTEVLTKAGWKTIDNISSEDETCNWDDGQMWYSKVKAIVKRERLPDERMVVLNSERRTIRVTEHHNMVYKYQHDPKWRKEKASEIIGKQICIPVNGHAEPVNFSDDEFFKWEPVKESARKRSMLRFELRSQGIAEQDLEAAIVERVNFQNQKLQKKLPSQLTIDECKLCGFLSCDGWLGKGKNSSPRLQVSISDAYPAIQVWFEGCLKAIGLDFSVYQKNAPKESELNGHLVTGTSYRFYNLPKGTGGASQKKRGYFYLQYMINKEYNRFLVGFSREQLISFIEGMHAADGSHGDSANWENRKRQVRITKGALSFFESVQIAAIQRGLDAKIRKINDARYKTEMYLLTVADFSYHQTSSVTSFQFEDLWMPERVWCVTTDSSNIVTRRHGLVSITGNTTGTNIPLIDCVVWMRPTNSAVLFVQGSGRASRLHPLKTNAMVLDLVGNMERFGSISNPNIPTASKSKKEEFSSSDLIAMGIDPIFHKGKSPVKECPECRASLHSAAKKCDSCGKLFIKVKAAWTGEETAYDHFDVSLATAQHSMSSGGELALICTYHTTNGVFKEWILYSRVYEKQRYHERKSMILSGRVQSVFVTKNYKNPKFPKLSPSVNPVCNPSSSHG